MTVVRKTISINKKLYDTIQKLRGNMIASGLDLSFTTTVNVVMVSGLMGCEEFNEEIWAEIANFFKGEQGENIDTIIDQYEQFLLQKLKDLREVNEI
ncbi:MAG: hypothetical protein R6U26_00610 [Candidatus Undinarchaeales archaeon]